MEQIMNLLWNMSYRGAVVIIIVLLIRAILLRKFPRKYAFWLWGIVGVCLLFPAEIVSSVSIFNILPDGNQIVQMLSVQSAEENRDVVREQNKDVSNIGQEESVESDTESNSAQVDIVSDEETEKNPDKSSMQDKAGVQNETVQADQGTEDKDGGVRPLEQKENAGENKEPGIILYRFLFFGWMLGVLVLFLWNLAGWLRIKRQVRSAVRLEGNVFECEDIPGPFVLGIISPKIYIPFRIEEEVRKYILAHERYHIKRRDNWTKMIAVAVLAVYWFHPLVWAAYILMGRDMEMSCDEHVLAGTGIQVRVKYSESLLSFATNRRSWNVQRMAFDAHTTRRRIKNVLTEKRSKRYMGIVFGVVAVVAVAVLLTQGTGGGTEKSKQGTVAEEDLTELTAYVEIGSYDGIQEGWFGELLKQKFHVKLNITPFIEEGDDIFGNDILLWRDADIDLKDYSIVTYQSAKNQGKLLPLSDGEYGHTLTISDTYHDDIFYTWDLRYDLYLKCGRPQIKDLDSLREVLKDMQSMCKGKEKVYGVSAWSSWDETNLCYATMLCSGYYGLAANDFVLYDNEGNVYDILDNKGAYVQALHFLNQLYRDGLLDPDSRTNTYEDVAAKAEEGQVLWSLVDYLGSVYYNTESHLNAGKAMYPVVPEDAVIAAYQTVYNKPVIAVNADTAHGDLCKRLVEYFSSPIGMMEGTYGPEGLFWYYDKEGKSHLTEAGRSWYESEDKYEVVIETDEKKYAMYDGMKFWDGFPMLNFEPFRPSDINPDTGEKYEAKYWESYVPKEETDNEMWETWKADHHVTQIQTYLEKRGRCSIYPQKYLADEEKPESWDTLSEIIVQGSWDAVYADNEAEFQWNINHMRTRAHKEGRYRECVAYSKKQVKEKLNKEE